jgi:hypothetical protein
MLSTNHQAPPGQDNNWSFRINPVQDDPVAQELSHIVNRSQTRIIRNIEERSGATLQILKGRVTSPPPGGLRVTASHNNVQQGADNLWQAIDQSPQTRWSSRAVQQPGMWFQIDLGQVGPVSGVTLDNAVSPQDYPRGYIVRLSADQQTWTTVAENRTNNGPLKVNFAARQARYIRIEQTGSNSVYWWSIHAIDIGGETPLTLKSSHNNVQQGSDNILQAIDGHPETRWSSRAAQQPGMWLEVDLTETRQVRGLSLQSARSPLDYPRGYRVQLSTDHSRWVEVAQHPQNEGELAVIFGPQSARYLRVEQTGQADPWWWSVHELTVDFTTKLGLRSSHNNVQQGTDNILQATDGRPESRWSSRAAQQPGMWLEIDIGQVRTVSGLVLESARSPLDYPRGYVVQVSTDRQAWQEVARQPNNETELDVTFKPQSVRYLRVEQTGQADPWWWSIHEIVIK